MVTIAAWHRRRVGGLVGVAVLAALSGGCTGADPAPSTSSTVSSTPTTTTPPPTTSAPPTTTTPTGTDGIPAAAKAHTTAGAEAFVRYFNDQVSRAYMVPDPTALQGLCQSTSKTCETFRQASSDLAKAKHHFDRPALAIDTLRQSGTGPAGSLRIVMKGVAEPARVLDTNGAVVETIDTKPAAFVYYVIWATQRWHIQEIKLEG